MTLMHCVKNILKLKKRELRSISYDKYEITINNYILPFLTDHPIETINTDIISNHLNELVNNGLSHNTAKIIKITLKGLYKYAESIYSLKHIDFSVIHVGTNDKSTNILDEYQEQQLFSYCCNHIDAFGITIILSLYGGLRFTEICALKYDDIHLSEGYLNVNKKVQRKVNRQNSLSKTVFSTEDLQEPEKRKVALSQFIISYLNEYMEQYHKDCYLLSNNYKLPEQRIYQRKLKDLGNTLGFEVNYMILRNTCKEKCIQSHVDIDTILKTFGLSKLIVSNDNKNIDINFNQKEMDKLNPTFNNFKKMILKSKHN